MGMMGILRLPAFQCALFLNESCVQWNLPERPPNQNPDWLPRRSEPWRITALGVRDQSRDNLPSV